MSNIDADELLPSERMRTGAAEGDVTQVHRGHRYADEGDTFAVDGESFEVVEVTERTLGDLTDEDARREGSADLDAYRERLVRAHGGEFEWDDDAEVYRHVFEPA